MGATLQDGSGNNFVVSSHNEWDPLEEVIVGNVENAMFPAWNTINKVTVPPGEWEVIEGLLGTGGAPYPEEMVAPARKCLEGFIDLLRGEGVVVRRSDPVDHAAPYSTPDWGIPSGFCAANPRDVFLVVGDEIIEAPMADRGRYFEARAFRSLLIEYFKAGARWTGAPKPRLLDAHYDSNYTAPGASEAMRYVTTESEPTFDAADFVRCGRDIFGQRSHVTNALGIDWLARHLGDQYRVHVVKTRCKQAMHIDTTLMPLAPGKVLVNPEFLDIERLPKIFRSWEVLVAPQPVSTATNPINTISGWANMNVLMLDEKRVIVEKSQEPMISALKKWGFTPLPCAFEAYYPFGGSFHCATLDIRRRGSLKSYF